MAWRRHKKDAAYEPRPRQAPPPAHHQGSVFRDGGGFGVTRPRNFAPRPEFRHEGYQQPDFHDIQGPGSMPGYFPGVAAPDEAYIAEKAREAKKSQKERKRDSRASQSQQSGFSQDSAVGLSETQDPYSQSLSQSSAGLSQDTYDDDFKSQGTSNLSQDSYLEGDTSAFDAPVAEVQAAAAAPGAYATLASASAVAAL